MGLYYAVYKIKSFTNRHFGRRYRSAPIEAKIYESVLEYINILQDLTGKIVEVTTDNLLKYVRDNMNKRNEILKICDISDPEFMEITGAVANIINNIDNDCYMAIKIPIFDNDDFILYAAHTSKDASLFAYDIAIPVTGGEVYVYPNRKKFRSII